MKVTFLKSEELDMYSFLLQDAMGMPDEERLPYLEQFLRNKFSSVFFIFKNYFDIKQMYFNFKEQSDEAFFLMHIDAEIEI